MEDIDKEYWKPSDLIQSEHGSLTLHLHGTEHECKALKILEAIKNGWHIDIQYADAALHNIYYEACIENATLRSSCKASVGLCFPDNARR